MLLHVLELVFQTLAFRAPPNGLGSGTYTFERVGFEVDDVLGNTAHFSKAILSSKYPTRHQNSSVANLIMVVRESIHFSTYLSLLSMSPHCTLSSSKASATLTNKVELALQPLTTASNPTTCS